MTLPDSSPFVIRPAVLQDLDALAAIDALCFPAGIAYPRQEISFLLRAPSILTLVAERSQTISQTISQTMAGFAALGHVDRKGSRYGELITIDVLPEFRRQHVGRQLHQALEEWFRAGNGRERPLLKAYSAERNCAQPFPKERMHETIPVNLQHQKNRFIQLHVAVNNPAALRFYEQLGYRTLQRVPRYYMNTLDAWKMEKLLPA